MGASTARNLNSYESIRFERIGSKIYAMAAASINHNRVMGKINGIFQKHLSGRKCESFLVSDVFLDDENVIPDVMIVCDKDKVKPRGVYGAPDLVVEILSPSTAHIDRSLKKTLYERSGVKELWLVDPSGKSIEVYVLENERYSLSSMYSIFDDELIDHYPEDYRPPKTPETFNSPTFPDMEVSLVEVFSNVE
jgi:Uma2 family endonuclease